MRLKNKTNRKAFSMIELIFVIVIMGILGKFGVEFLFQAYNGFIQTKISNQLQANSSAAVEYVSSKLKNRIKASLIVREKLGVNPPFQSLDGYSLATAPIIEWIGADVESYRGDTGPFWSGVLDLQASTHLNLVPLGGDLGKVDALIQTLSDGGSTIDDAAIYFIGSYTIAGDADGWGWDSNTTVFDTQVGHYIHPIKRNGTSFTPVKSDGTATVDSFVGYEYYQLAWTAYAIGIDDYDDNNNSGTLSLWYDYQPWKGEKYTDDDTKKITIMENVSSFQFLGVNSLVKIQVCTKSRLIKDEEYSICKEKTIF